jgi:hypothetical protein
MNKHAPMSSVFVLGWISPSPLVINMVLVHLIATLVMVTVTAEQTSECAGIAQAQSERGKVGVETGGGGVGTRCEASTKRLNDCKT